MHPPPPVAVREDPRCVEHLDSDTRKAKARGMSTYQETDNHRVLHPNHLLLRYSNQFPGRHRFRSPSMNDFPEIVHLITNCNKEKHEELSPLQSAYRSLVHLPVTACLCCYRSRIVKFHHRQLSFDAFKDPVLRRDGYRWKRHSLQDNLRKLTTRMRWIWMSIRKSLIVW
jgi:hypothetical protein